MKIKTNKNGFTLAEMLIIVAIIGVLVGISIPIFTNQLEKAREAVDMANLRAAYAECSAAVLTGTSPGNGYTIDYTNGNITCSIKISLTQKENGWQSGAPEIGGIKFKETINPSGLVTIVIHGDGSKPYFGQGTSSLEETPELNSQN